MRKTLEIVGLGVLAALCWITWQALSGPDRLPDRIPTHFDISGNPNAWGSPNMLFLLPIVATAVYLLTTVLAAFPSTFHYPVRIDPDRLPRAQEQTRDMISWIKVEMAGVLVYVQWSIIQAAHSKEFHMSPLMIPVFLVVLFGTVGWYIAAILKNAKEGTSSASSS
jgi:uncharacterized membrane protein